MKKLLFASILAVGLAAGLLTQSGCTTVQRIATDANGNIITNVVVVFDPVSAQAAVSGIAELGVYMAVQQDPETVPYFRLAVATLTGLANANEFDPATIEKNLMDLQINQMKNPYVILGVRAALIFYKSAFSTVVSAKLNEAQNLKPIILAIAGGITSGLNSYNVELRYNIPSKPPQLRPPAPAVKP